MCQSEGLWQSNGRESLKEFYDRTGGRVRGLPINYEELVSNWEKIRARLLDNLKVLQNQNLTLYLERINSSILLRDSFSQKKIWMNYKLLEAEIERVDARKKVLELYFPGALLTTLNCYRSLRSRLINK